MTQLYLHALFPERVNNVHCRTVYIPRDCMSHHAELSVSLKRPTIEFRLHGGTVLWPIAVCWADWCDGIARGRPSRLGLAYLAARFWNRIHIGHPTPLHWATTIIDDAKVLGVKNTLTLIEHGAYHDLEDHHWTRHLAVNQPEGL